MSFHVESHQGITAVLERLLGVLSALPVAVIVIVTFIDVFARYLFSAPLKGSMEIVEYAMALLIFTALPLVTRKRQHVSVSLIDNWVKGQAKRLKMTMCDALSAAALWLLAWRLWAQAVEDWDVGTQTEVLGLLNAPLNFSLAFLAAVAGLVALGLMWQSAKTTGAPA
tara:strand:+ start:65947 stop:66450 length:504 start_codon:yes stop_codon:yes gene_type:complete